MLTEYLQGYKKKIYSTTSFPDFGKRLLTICSDYSFISQDQQGFLNNYINNISYQQGLTNSTLTIFDQQKILDMLIVSISEFEKYENIAACSSLKLPDTFWQDKWGDSYLTYRKASPVIYEEEERRFVNKLYKDGHALLLLFVMFQGSGESLISAVKESVKSKRYSKISFTHGEHYPVHPILDLITTDCKRPVLKKNYSDKKNNQVQKSNDCFRKNIIGYGFDEEGRLIEMTEWDSSGSICYKDLSIWVDNSVLTFRFIIKNNTAILYWIIRSLYEDFLLQTREIITVRSLELPLFHIDLSKGTMQYSERGASGFSYEYLSLWEGGDELLHNIKWGDYLSGYCNINYNFLTNENGEIESITESSLIRGRLFPPLCEGKIPKSKRKDTTLKCDRFKEPRLYVD